MYNTLSILVGKLEKKSWFIKGIEPTYFAFLAERSATELHELVISVYLTSVQPLSWYWWSINDELYFFLRLKRIQLEPSFIITYNWINQQNEYKLCFFYIDCVSFHFTIRFIKPWNHFDHEIFCFISFLLEKGLMSHTSFRAQFKKFFEGQRLLRLYLTVVTFLKYYLKISYKKSAV